MALQVLSARSPVGHGGFPSGHGRSFRKINGDCSKSSSWKVEQELAAFDNGTHKGYLKELKLLEKAHWLRLKECEEQKKRRLREAEILYEAEIKAAEHDLEDSKIRLVETMKEKLREKRRKAMLQDQGVEVKANMRTRNRKRKNLSKEKDKRYPRVRYTLTFDEIKKDIALMKKPFQPKVHQQVTQNSIPKRRSTRARRKFIPFSDAKPFEKKDSSFNQNFHMKPVTKASTIKIGKTNRVRADQQHDFPFGVQEKQFPTEEEDHEAVKLSFQQKPLQQSSPTPTMNRRSSRARRPIQFQPESLQQSPPSPKRRSSRTRRKPKVYES